MTQEEIARARKEFFFPSIAHYYSEPLILTRAKDQYVWDADGNQYLDFFGGIVTVSVGHCNDAVTGAIEKQLETLQHVSTLFATEPPVVLAKKLAGIVPSGWPAKVFLTNSGTEANETAVVAARCFTGATDIVALRYSYHGRSAMAMSLTGQAGWRLGGVSLPGITHAHNAYCYRCPFGLKYPDCGVACARDVEELIKTTTSGRIAAFIAEPIQGVAGFVTPPPEYFPIVAEIIRRYGGVYISDEVQTAWGRTGDKWFGIEQWNVTPDIIVSAKGLGNGMPIGVTVARAEIADSMKGLTISTFGGNPVVASAASAVLDFIEERNLRRNTAEMGKYLRDKLVELQAKYPIIGDVRGMGLLQAVELVKDRTSKTPAPVETNVLMEAARTKRILLGKGGLYGNVLRISPPMTIGRADIDTFIQALDRSFEACCRS
jgi:4-aminobutyrate aminotransferase